MVSHQLEFRALADAPSVARPEQPAPAPVRLRLAAAGMLETEKQFRRVKGYRQLPQLASTIKKATTTTSNPYLSHRLRSISRWRPAPSSTVSGTSS